MGGFQNRDRLEMDKKRIIEIYELVTMQMIQIGGTF